MKIPSKILLAASRTLLVDDPELVQLKMTNRKMIMTNLIDRNDQRKQIKRKKLLSRSILRRPRKQLMTNKISNHTTRETSSIQRL